MKLRVNCQKHKKLQTLGANGKLQVQLYANVLLPEYWLLLPIIFDWLLSCSATACVGVGRRGLLERQWSKSATELK